ncbi:uncharacterized protein FA14DRAFT_127492 [Meira miltonrushii]|uniref:T6SS Phospholipase effector Tle1-like catalytic domain-containing protein n=1 Tax=Meira miltonrushii TaxID=1280837 RepID=A0A316V3F1_9BASI|nr:uncharacterized protein FA14DRAFT_127492 [Meira miltonrushii]PWN31518.1 hypothetical protein FA14DRAFT_127492 [Meira miltonrushii]
MSTTPQVCFPPILAALQDNTTQAHRARNVIVCLDGSGDQFDNDNSNVVKFFAALKKDCPTQLTYYQTGVGTYYGSCKGSIKKGFSAGWDIAVGASLDVHVRGAYSFLMQNYREGDKICLIGFSRGAYTARALAGMLHKVGLLPAHNQAQIAFAYRWYEDDSEYGWKMSADFKRTFSIDADIHFLGCWDTVTSVGVIPKTLPFAKTNRSVRYFRHALALDERRAKFKPNRWTQRDELRRTEEEEGGHQDEPEHVLDADSSTFERALNAHHKRASLLDIDRKEFGDYGQPTDVLEVWFLGGHADCGGGAVANDTRHMVSRIPLRWMLRQTFECNTGILFHTDVLAEHGLDVETLWPKYVSRKAPSCGPPPSALDEYASGTLPSLVKRLSTVSTWRETGVLPEMHEDYFDSLAEISDQLVKAKKWWILELWPVGYYIKTELGEWKKKIGPNLGRYRTIRTETINLHWTVVQRQESKNYKIKCLTDDYCNWNIIY